MEYTVINYLFDKGETVSEGICFTSQSKVTGLLTPDGRTLDHGYTLSSTGKPAAQVS